MVLKESSQERKLTGETSNSTTALYSAELTRAVLPVTREAAQAEAGMAADCVDTPGKLTALLLPCLTLVHICD